MIDNETIIQRLEFLEKLNHVAVCPYCHKATNTNLTEHRKIQHTVNTTIDPVYLCEHCGGKFTIDRDVIHKV